MFKFGTTIFAFNTKSFVELSVNLKWVDRIFKFDIIYLTFIEFLIHIFFIDNSLLLKIKVKI